MLVTNSMLVTMVIIELTLLVFWDKDLTSGEWLAVLCFSNFIDRVPNRVLTVAETAVRVHNLERERDTINAFYIREFILWLTLWLIINKIKENRHRVEGQRRQ